MELKILYLWRSDASLGIIEVGTVCLKYLLIFPKNVIITFLSVMAWRVMFGKVICLVCGAFFPFYFELLLGKYSTSAADNTTFLSVWHSVSIGALNC